MFMAATVRHESVAGVQISAANTAPVSLNSSPELLPPTTITSPDGSVTELWNARRYAIAVPLEITGLAPLRSTLYTAFVGVAARVRERREQLVGRQREQRRVPAVRVHVRERGPGERAGVERARARVVRIAARRHDPAVLERRDAGAEHVVEVVVDGRE